MHILINTWAPGTRGVQGGRTDERQGWPQEEKTRGVGKGRRWSRTGVPDERSRGKGHGQRWRMASMEAGYEGMADEDKNPQKREQGPRRQRLGRCSTGAPTGADRAGGRRGAGSSVCAARSSAHSEKSDMMQKYLCTGVLLTCVLVEYGERWYGTRQQYQMRWARGDTQRGVETDRSRSKTSGGDMELRCLLEALGLQGSHWLSSTPWAVHSCLPRDG